jgi:ribosome assembly protein YihI (activator of Der GTPase)
MENMYKHMLKDLLKKKFRTISSEKGSLVNLGKLEIIEELYDHLGFEDIDDEELTADQIMVGLYKTH